MRALVALRLTLSSLPHLALELSVLEWAGGYDNERSGRSGAHGDNVSMRSAVGAGRSRPESVERLRSSVLSVVHLPRRRSAGMLLVPIQKFPAERHWLGGTPRVRSDPFFEHVQMLQIRETPDAIAFFYLNAPFFLRVYSTRPVTGGRQQGTRQIEVSIKKVQRAL